MLTLYTQDRCGYCILLKNKLIDWGYHYVEENIMYDAVAKDFVRKQNHTTVPQLYYDGRDMLKGDSVYLTNSLLIERMDESWGERPEISF